MKKLLILSVLSAVLLLGGCAEKKTTDNDGKLNIVTTIGMITDLVENIGGERVTVSGLMGPGVDPHLYKASEGDVHRLSQADIIFYNGLHLEGAMTEVLEKMSGRIKTVAVAEDIDESLLLSPAEFEGAHDPHVWFDVTMWMKAAEKITETLMEQDTSGIEYYLVRSDSLMKKLVELDEYVKSQAARVPEDKRVLITAHDAFNYFGRAYGFEVRGLQGISTAAEAGTADVQSLVKFIAERKIPAIFVESSVPPRNIEAVKAAVRSQGFEVNIGGELYSDAMGALGTPDGTYIGMVRHNIDTIVGALLGENETKE
jgi:manganese/zinc/iron transport system substrate-binding protein